MFDLGFLPINLFITEYTSYGIVPLKYIINAKIHSLLNVLRRGWREGDDSIMWVLREEIREDNVSFS
jgi:hypothetical protein